ncbi:hypothetical protein JL720_3875 [Aureococcus anophagefferens]|nr:hypothetical protein JL720_3875 [Aureococcus anophagefferens]
MGCHRAAPAALAFVAGIFAAVVVFQAQHVFAASSCRRKIDGAKPAVLNRHVFFYDFGDRTAPPLAPAAPRPPARAPTAGPGRRASRRASRSRRRPADARARRAPRGNARTSRDAADDARADGDGTLRAPPRPPRGPGEGVSRCVSRFYYERDARGTVAADVALRGNQPVSRTPGPNFRDL